MTYIPDNLEPSDYIRITSKMTSIDLQEIQFEISCSAKAEITLSIFDSNALVADYPSAS